MVCREMFVYPLFLLGACIHSYNLQQSYVGCVFGVMMFVWVAI